MHCCRRSCSNCPVWVAPPPQVDGKPVLKMNMYGALARGRAACLLCAAAPLPGVTSSAAAAECLGRALHLIAIPLPPCSPPSPAGTTWRAASAPCLSRNSAVSCRGGSGCMLEGSTRVTRAGAFFLHVCILGMMAAGSQSMPIPRPCRRHPLPIPRCRAQVGQGRRRGRGPGRNLGGGAAHGQEAQV